MKYLGNTFSPMMLASWAEAQVNEVELADIPPTFNPITKEPILTSIVSHEITAQILTTLLQEPVAFNRVNVQLQPGDWLYCIVPNFRAAESREFTFEEVSAAGFRCFLVEIKGR